MNAFSCPPSYLYVLHEEERHVDTPATPTHPLIHPPARASIHVTPSLLLISGEEHNYIHTYMQRPTLEDLLFSVN